MGTKYIFIYSHRLSRHVCMIAISVCIQKSTRIIFYIFVVYMPLYIFIHYTYSVCLDGQIYKYMYLCTCCLSIVSQLACILYGYIHKFIHPCRNVQQIFSFAINVYTHMCTFGQRLDMYVRMQCKYICMHYILIDAGKYVYI